MVQRHQARVQKKGTQGSTPGTPDAGKKFTGFPIITLLKNGPWGLKMV
jgi:hypothetical protein